MQVCAASACPAQQRAERSRRAVAAFAFGSSCAVCTPVSLSPKNLGAQLVVRAVGAADGRGPHGLRACTAAAPVSAGAPRQPRRPARPGRPARWGGRPPPRHGLAPCPAPPGHSRGTSRPFLAVGARVAAPCSMHQAKHPPPRPAGMGSPQPACAHTSFTAPTGSRRC